MDALALQTMALAITHFEGMGPDRNFRNNNPGNLKYANQRKAIGQDAQHFAVFANLRDGLEALNNQLLLDAHRHPLWSIAKLIDDYAPPADHNPNNRNYAREVSAALGVPTTETLQSALGLI